MRNFKVAVVVVGLLVLIGCQSLQKSVAAAGDENIGRLCVVLQMPDMVVPGMVVPGAEPDATAGPSPSTPTADASV